MKEGGRSTFRPPLTHTGEQEMSKKRMPNDERKPEDYREAAEDSLELAKVLAGQGGISDQDFLERMARSDDLVDHDGETCGMCHNTILGAQVARDMIETGEYEDVVSKWAAETRRAGKRANSSSCGNPNRKPVVTRKRRSRTGAGSHDRGTGRGIHWDSDRWHRRGTRRQGTGEMEGEAYRLVTRVGLGCGSRSGGARVLSRSGNRLAVGCSRCVDGGDFSAALDVGNGRTDRLVSTENLIRLLVEKI